MALTLKNKDSDNPETPPNPPSISDLPEPVFPEDRANLLAPTCFQCGKKISGAHFAMGSDKVCPECKAAIEQAFNQGSKSKRFLKAGILGAFAALIGATVYFLVTWKTGYQYAIIAIGIGWMVGAAVRHGSERQGGAPYQALAVLLTYLALALPNIPLAVMTWDEEGYLEEDQSTAYYEEEGFIEDESAEPGQDGQEGLVEPIERVEGVRQCDAPHHRATDVALIPLVAGQFADHRQVAADHHGEPVDSLTAAGVHLVRHRRRAHLTLRESLGDQLVSGHQPDAGGQIRRRGRGLGECGDRIEVE